jgi:SAM-dependent methyltransferase
MKITLPQAEVMSQYIANGVAKSKFWKENPLAKATADLDRFVEALPGKDILDLGCGYGAYTTDFTERCLNYYGIDHSMEMISAARAEHPFPKAKFVCMSMNNMLFPNETFAGIWSCCSITTTPKVFMGKNLEKMRALLKPEGVMMTIVPNYNFSHDGISEHDPKPFWRTAYTPSEFRELFRHTGFHRLGFWEDRDNGAMSILVKK